MLYCENWEKETFGNCLDDFYWKDLIFYFNLYKIEYEHITLPMEWMFYFPKIENISNILYDLEKIKPIFDWISTVVTSQYSGNGNGEGLGLSYVLDKNKVKMTKFDKNLFQKLKKIQKLI